MAEMKMKMTIEECKKRKREYKRMLENIELLRLSLLRSIAVEDLNIRKLREKRKVKDEDRQIRTMAFERKM